MNSLFRFDPHSENFKKPFGAVKCGTEISFSAKAMRVWAYNIELLVFEENTGNDKAFQAMPHCSNYRQQCSSYLWREVA